ncbi:MAG: rhodanese-like domain-containing protein [Verrucomicrobiales bacterium]|nr:rhodanese-like domain-containing protein [Verrucomicrobiales bacterium]
MKQTFTEDGRATEVSRSTWSCADGGCRDWWGPAVLVPLLLVLQIAQAMGQELRIESLSRQGVLTWTNAQPGWVCRVEWAPSSDGPWSGSWETLVDIPSTNQWTTRPVPMLYRVVTYPPPTPQITDVTAAAALPVVEARLREPAFVVLDVRTPTEFGIQHLKAALNVDFYSKSFEQMLGKLDRKRTYLVYCASGGRSRRASTAMQKLGFLDILNVSDGFSTFAALPGAADYLEP